MKRAFPIGILVLALLWVGSTFVPPRAESAFALATFGRLPVLANGRIKPIDTMARTSLLMLQGRQRLVGGQGQTVAPAEWLLDVWFRPDVADGLRVFRIDHPEVLAIFGLSAADLAGEVRFSYGQLQAGLPELERQAQLAGPVEAATRTAFQRGVGELAEHLDYYNRLKYTVQTPDLTDLSGLLGHPEQWPAQRASFVTMETFSALRVIAPPAPSAALDGWRNSGQALLAALDGGSVNSSLGFYANLGRAWRAGEPATFNSLVTQYRDALAGRMGPALRRGDFEARFNAAQPFYTSMVLYVAAFLLAVISWLRWPAELGRAAFALMALAFVLATAGIIARMWLEDRPPVTNLYSSALFIGWGAVGLCLVLERMSGRAVASSAGSLIGFATLVIAHHLSLSGDTLEMMRAVLDSNFWLATHVVTVTTGYAATFLAGFLAMIYLLRGVLSRTLDRATADALSRMVYGIVCFATLFSLVGTVLGGIWADQSWGRFWGWDPKENGALMIVIWNAIILHCRWGGLVKQRGLMALAVFGNIVTAWSWFGTNMLGVGLHSYGFTNAAFQGLVAFVAVQLAVMALAAVPGSKWRSALTA